MTLKIDLPDQETAKLAAKAQSQGLSPEQYAREILVHDLREPSPPPHVWETIAANMKDVPPEELAALPKDALTQIDHYVYGTLDEDGIAL